MPTVTVDSTEGLACMRCGRRASFHTPIGPFCPTDALLAAAFHDWIPTRIQNEHEAGGDPSHPPSADA